MRKLLTVSSVLLAAAALSGCVNYAAPLAPAPQLSPAERNFDAVWQASLKVLRDYRFTPDREDRRAGVITTEPMTGEVFGEFWRSDAATAKDLAESSIQTIYRLAKVTIEPVGDDKTGFKAVVEVQTYRSDRPEPQVSSASEAIDLFRVPGSANSRKDLVEYGPSDKPEYVVALGRDLNLESKIAADIAAATTY